MSVKFCFNLKTQKKAEPTENGLYLKAEGGPTVLLIHGLTGTPNEMRFLANFLNKKNYSVTCPRLVNHGEPLEILKKTKWQEFYKSVRDVFYKLTQSHNGSPIFVAGLSMGALLALLLADEFPEMIAGVICLSPTLFYDGWNTPWSKHLLPIVCNTPLKHFLYFKEEPPYGIKNEAIRQRLHDYYQKADLNHLNGVAKYGYPYFPVALLSELGLLIEHLKRKLPRIHIPVQLIQAKEDDMTSVKNSQFVYDRICSKIKEIVLLENSYHVITADQERETVAEKMEQFMHRLSNGAYPKGVGESRNAFATI